MNIPEFVLAFYKENVALVSAIAWPSAVVISVWLFRREVRGLLDRVVSVNWRDGVLQLREAVREAQADIAEVEAEKSLARGDNTEVQPSLPSQAAPSSAEEFLVNERVYLGRASNDNSRTLLVNRATWRTYSKLVKLVNELSLKYASSLLHGTTTASMPTQVAALVGAGVIPTSVGNAILELRSQRRRFLSLREKEPQEQDLEAFNSLAGEIYGLVQRGAAVAISQSSRAENEIPEAQD